MGEVLKVSGIVDVSLGTNWLWSYASWCLGQNLAAAGALFAVRKAAYGRGYTLGHNRGYERGYTRGSLEGRIDEWEDSRLTTRRERP